MLCAGIKEEGMNYRFVKVYYSTDLGIIAIAIVSTLDESQIKYGIPQRLFPHEYEVEIFVPDIKPNLESGFDYNKSKIAYTGTCS